MPLKFVDLFCEGDKKIKVWHDKKGYAIIYKDGKEIKLHVYIWEKENGKKPKGYDIHHKDFNKANYELVNLLLVTKSDHRKIHAGWIMNAGVWTHKPCAKCKKLLPLSSFYKRLEWLSAKCKECHNDSCVEIYKKKMGTKETATELRNYKKLKAREYREKLREVGA